MDKDCVFSFLTPIDVQGVVIQAQVMGKELKPLKRINKYVHQINFFFKNFNDISPIADRLYSKLMVKFYQ